MNKKAKHPNVRMVWSFTKGVRKAFAWTIIASVFAILLNYIRPLIVSYTVDTVIGSEKTDIPGFLQRILDSLAGTDTVKLLLYCTASIVICVLLAAVFNYFSRMAIAKATQGFTKSLRDKLFGHIQRLPFSWHSGHQTGEIIQRCTSDVEVLQNFIGNRFYEVVRTVLLIGIALALMYSMNVKLAIVCTVSVPLIVAYSALFHKRISKQFRVCDDAEGELTVQIQENLTGVRVVRAFGREKLEWERFTEKNEVFAKKWIDLGYTLGFFWSTGDMVTSLQMLATICIGAVLAAKGELTLGELLAFISYTQTLAWPVRALGRTLSELSKAGVSIDRLREILEASEEEYGTGEDEAPIEGDIVFEDVSFSYGDNKVLDHLSFTLKKGETLGVLGATGSGKSTITYLLNRLYDLPEGCGRITIGGVDIKDISRTKLRKSVGLVLQEAFLYSKTVGENLKIAADNPTQVEMEHAAQVASVHSDILRFADKYDTLVGERGVTLSGGQKQRIAIARTLMMKCPIMVFDDSMSAVDMETDAAIREALRKDTADATVILVSHRINTLMQADKILVLEDGKAAEIGSHSELVARPGTYQRVYHMQSDAGLNTEGGEA